MKRRKFITLLGGAAAAWPVVARAQATTPPVVGFLLAASGLGSEKRMAKFQQGMAELGYDETVKMVKVNADGEFERLPDLVLELLRRNVNVIVVPQSSQAALAAHGATKTVPIIFSTTVDPVALGLVQNHARPGGNATGAYTLSTDLAAKRLGLLRELVPTSKVAALLVNPATRANAIGLKEATDAAAALGLDVRIMRASTVDEIDAAFASLAAVRPDCLLVLNDPLFATRNMQIVLLTARHGIPAILTQREYVDVGGLMSYGTNSADAYRWLGVYTGRVLKGAKPEELPVVQSSRFEFIINLQAARAIGLTVPATLLARADEVIE
jgi:putative ABC transport system substrate-binding protein